MYENGRRLVEMVVDVLELEPSGLFCDIDGTISPIVQRAEDARVDERARAALDGLRRRLALVTIVTGRNVADARRMVGLDGVTYVGNHGLEIDGEIIPEARPWVAKLRMVLDVLQKEVTLPGVRFEDKGATLSVHYREATDTAAAQHMLRAVVSRQAQQVRLRVEEGRLVFNILPPVEFSKGTAVASLAQRHGLRGVACIGDDVTDTHAFAALKTMQARTLSIAVVGDETPAIVRESADATVPNVNAVADLLCGVLERLQAGGSMTSRSTHNPED